MKGMTWFWLAVGWVVFLAAIAAVILSQKETIAATWRSQNSAKGV